MLEREGLLTTKQYSADYLRFLRDLKGEPVEVVSKVDRSSILRASPWWSPIYSKEKDRKLHSKLTSTTFFKQMGYSDEVELVDSVSALKEMVRDCASMLFKNEGGMSGRGHYVWPRDKDFINKALEKHQKFLVQPLRQRTVDFSCLFLDRDEFIIYETIVDDKFQYRGTRFADFVLPNEYETDYLDFVKKAQLHYLDLGAAYPFCIDSYFYQDLYGKQRLCKLSEVNTRKTMGYIAYRLKQKFEASYASFYIFNKKTTKRAKSLQRDIICLSPQEGMFESCFIVASSLRDLENKERVFFESLKSLELM